MPTRRVRSSERRRCAKACISCKRRKERCDGSQPCSRCVGRGVGADCRLANARRESPNSTLTSPPPNLNDNHNEKLVSNPAVGEPPVSIADGDSLEQHPSAFPAYAAPVAQQPRLIQDGRGTFMFIGDAAHLSFLQIIRRLVSDSLGPCPFVDDPLRHYLVEETPRRGSNWVVETVQQPPAIPDPVEIKYLLSWYMRVAECGLNLFHEPELHADLSQWLEAVQDGREQEAQTAVFFLIFAIGAQSCPEDRDSTAQRYFNYGRLMNMSVVMEYPSITTVRVNVLIAIYLLGASRRNAAFVYLGTAVRAAYALGIHRADINVLFSTSENIARERLWKALRLLDLFMSASLGRPPSTLETRDTKAEAGYSTSNDLYAILETILTQVYSKRMVSTKVLEQVSEHHRHWTSKFTTGLAIDGIQSDEFLDIAKGGKGPNIGLLHLKGVYYWTIMLISRPFLIESISRHVSQTANGLENQGESTPASASSKVLAHACVDSAVRTIDLLHVLLSVNEIPKRLPFVVDLAFAAALVLGLAQFGDVDQLFLLESGLARAQQLLLLFSSHDAIARRNLTIVENLQAACSASAEQRAKRKMELNRLLVGELFGTLHSNFKPEKMQTRRTTREDALRSSQAFQCRPTPVTDTDGGSTIGLSSPERAVTPELQSPLDAVDKSLNVLPDMASITNMSLPISPITLMFDSFDQSVPLFSAMEANFVEAGDDFICESILQ